MVLSSHGILVEPFLCANDQRKHYAELFGTHGISNDRALPAIFTAGDGQKEAMGSNHFVFVDNLGVFGVCIEAPRPMSRKYSRAS